MAMERVTVDGQTLNKRTAKMLKYAEWRSGLDFSITQGSYNPGDIGASAGTHDGGGAVDIRSRDHTDEEKKRVVRALREVGFAAWYRPTTDDWAEHYHAIAIGDPELAYEAGRQVEKYYAGGDGLAGMNPDTGPRLDPIPTWPIKLRKIDLQNVIDQFTAETPTRAVAIKKVQRALNRRLGTNLRIDGIAGPSTKKAYKKWEERVGAPAGDGMPGAYSLWHLVRGYYKLVK